MKSHGIEIIINNQYSNEKVLSEDTIKESRFQNSHTQSDSLFQNNTQNKFNTLYNFEDKEHSLLIENNDEGYMESGINIKLSRIVNKVLASDSKNNNGL